ncbi:hypothetical protein MNBD_GAMMA02-686 [hydrothermal vent metagenome]|uniref:Uncharacterized protein n=1 Tax=hydrothermal vent metagenome TaxID=652676 RepID=A0A3B0WNK7_9ZZZZ
MKHSKLILLLLLVMRNTALLAATLNIPAGHPRLWFTSPAELSQARSWYASNPTNPANDDYLGMAFQSLMTQDPSGCQQAIQPALDIQIDTSQVSSDSAR